jgi:hypothetical protein
MANQITLGKLDKGFCPICGRITTTNYPHEYCLILAKTVYPQLVAVNPSNLMAVAKQIQAMVDSLKDFLLHSTLTGGDVKGTFEFTITKEQFEKATKVLSAIEKVD